jgi:hypothetical protein
LRRRAVIAVRDEWYRIWYCRQFHLPANHPLVEAVTYADMVQAYFEIKYFENHDEFLKAKTELLDRTDSDIEWMEAAEAAILRGEDPIGAQKEKTRKRSERMTKGELEQSAKKMNEFDKRLDIDPELLGDALDNG